MFLGLRRIGGINLSEFETTHGVDLRQSHAAAFEANVANGLLEVVDNKLRLTAEGRFVADSVVVDFL